jgi:hypothetical protein
MGNSEDPSGGLSDPGGSGGPRSAGPGSDPNLEEERKKFEGVVMRSAATGLLPQSELSHQMQLVHAAKSVDELREIIRNMPLLVSGAQSPPSFGPPSSAKAPESIGPPSPPADLNGSSGAYLGNGNGSGTSTARNHSNGNAGGHFIGSGDDGLEGAKTLDAVDLAILQKKVTTKKSVRGLSKSSAMVLVVVIMAGLLVMGLLLATKVHAPSTGTVTSTTTVSGGVVVQGLPDPLSSWGTTHH